MKEPLKKMKLSEETNIIVNILCKKDEEGVNQIKSNLNRPLIYLHKLDPNCLIMPLSNGKRKIQKAKRNGQILHVSTSLSSLNGNRMDSSQNYNINDLRSDDETDDETNPRKDVPLWATEPHLGKKAAEQSKLNIDYDYMFRGQNFEQKIVLKKTKTAEK